MISNHPPSYPLRVAYDAKAFTDKDHGTGKGAYLKMLLADLGLHFMGLTPAAPAHVDLPLYQRGTRRYLAWQQTALPEMLRTLKPQIFLAPNNTAPWFMPTGVELVAIVHDLILLERLPVSSLRTGLRDRYRGTLMRRTIRQARLILTVSEFTAVELRKLFPSADVRIVYNTLEASWFVRNNVIPLSQREPYILVVTSNIPHKNVERTIQAFARYKSLHPVSPLKLRMVGVSTAAAHIQVLSERSGVAQEVIIENYIAERDLQGLYRSACCILVPSLMEGFGIPLLEAMSSGTPLASSNAWSLPEVAGDAAIYFNPYDVQEMAQALHRATTDEALRTRLSLAGLARAERFHPDLIHQDVRKFWEELPQLYARWHSDL